MSDTARRPGLWSRIVRRINYVMGPRIASALRKRLVLLRNPHADIRFDGPVYLGPGFHLHMPEGGTFHVGPATEFRYGFRAEIAKGGRITIGSHCVFSYSAVIQCTTSIEIQDRAWFGQSLMLVDGNHYFRDPDRPLWEEGYEYTPIVIEEDVAVWTKSTICASIGEHARIASNSVVNRPIPAFTFAGGVPARVIDYFGPEDRRPAELAASD